MVNSCHVGVAVVLPPRELWHKRGVAVQLPPQQSRLNGWLNGLLEPPDDRFPQTPRVEAVHATYSLNISDSYDNIPL